MRDIYRRCIDTWFYPAKTRLGLKLVEYVGHLISSTGSSFTEEKRLQVLDFPLPEIEKALLQFIGLANYFRDHVPFMTEMVQPLRKLMDMKKFKGSKKLTWTEKHFTTVESQYLIVRSYIFRRTLKLPFYRLMHPTMVLVVTCT